VQQLELEKKPRAGAPFEIPPIVTPKAAGRARVTVIIPSYNHERFVGAAIDSVLAQTGPRVRVLLVDDASTDGTLAAARTRRDPRLEIRRNGKNLGLGESLYRALRAVRTPFVAILNSDDLFHPERIDRLLAALEARPRAEVAASLLAPVDADGRACTVADSSPVFDGKRVHDWLQWFDAACQAPPTSGELVRPLLERNYLVTSSNLVARRDFLLELAPKWRDLEYCVDWQVFLAAAAQGSLRIVDEPLLAYRLHASNTVWFDEEREWRFYVESHRVVARTLELLLARGRDGQSRFAEQLEVIAGHLAGNDAIDGAGLYLGLLLERLKIPSRAIRTPENRRWIQTLESMRRMRLHVRDVVHVLGDNFGELLRMRGERPWLRTARNLGEAVADELDRMKWELQSALADRRNLEKLWRQAERERDQEISGKADLFRRIGEVEGEAHTARSDAATARTESEAARKERDAKEAELRRLSEVRSDLQSTLQSVQGEHESLRRDLEQAIGSLHGGKGPDSKRERTEDLSAREREALRLTLERLHEESAVLQDELERTRTSLDATRQRAQAEQDVERNEAVRRLEEERNRLIERFESEHAKAVAAVQVAAAERLAQSLAAEAAARLELAEEAARREAEAVAHAQAQAATERDALLARTKEEHARERAAERAELTRVAAEEREAAAYAAANERTALLAQAAAELAAMVGERDAARDDVAALDARVTELAERTRKLEEETKRLQALANQRTWERDALQRAPEYRFGHLVLNKMKLRKPLRAVEKTMHGARVRLASARLGAERRGLLARGGNKPRVFSTICWNFPIWSQTFVYQELMQMAKRGFELRVVYSKLEPREHLHQQFAPLWDFKRVMHIDRAIHRRDFERYQARFPDRVEKLVERLAAAARMPREAILAHDNFQQGFTYTRMAESWGAQYLHSYFFYDRSLMSLIAGEVLQIPRGVSCYADHLLNDYELKVVPLHLQTCEVVVATSARIKRELLALAPDTPTDKILVKPNAIDCTRFPVLPRPEPEPGSPFRLVVTSRIEPKKGLIYLVEAVKKLRDEGLDVEAHIVGDVDKGVATSENYKAELCDLITRLDLWGKIHLEGRQPEQGVRKFLSIAQLFVAPFVETDYGDKDGIPTALVEALATGIPAVVTDAGSILEVVDDRVEARVVPQRNPAALATAIRELLQDPKGRRFMGHKAAQRAREKFDVSVCEPWLHDRIQSLLANARK
jgi:glycosyltransferase involved in cell wall biosynthesis